MGVALVWLGWWLLGCRLKDLGLGQGPLSGVPRRLGWSFNGLLSAPEKPVGEPEIPVGIRNFD